MSKFIHDAALEGLRRVRQGEVERHRQDRTRSRRARRWPTGASWSGRAGRTPTSSGAASRRCSRSWPSRSSCRRSRSPRRRGTRSRPRSASPSPSRSRTRTATGSAPRSSPYGLVYHPVQIKRLGIAGAEGLGRPAQSQAQGRGRAVRAHPLVVVQRDLRGHPVDVRRGQGLGVAHEAAPPTPATSPRAAATCRRWWPRASTRAGFAVPSYMAFEEKLAGFDLRFVAPKNAFVTPEPMAILTGARNPQGRARLHRVPPDRARPARLHGARPVPDHAQVQGAGRAGLDGRAGRAVHRRRPSYFDGEVTNVYDEARGRQALGGAQDALPLRHRGGSGSRRTSDRPRMRILLQDRGQAISAASPPSIARISTSPTASCSRCWARRGAARPRCCA